MKQAGIVLLFFGAAVFCMSGCGRKQDVAVQDITAAFPGKTSVLLDNEYIKAVVFTLEPGESLPLHKGGPRAVYALSDYTIQWTEHGNTEAREWKQGEAHWHDGLEHAVKNTGTTQARYLTVTRKETALPETGSYTYEHDAAAADTAHSRAVFENENVRIIHVRLEPGEEQPSHQGITRMVFSLSSYNILYTSDVMDDAHHTFEKYAAHWHRADEHAVHNTGDTIADYVIFEFKK